MAMTDPTDLERELLIEELTRPKPKNGNTGVTGYGLDPTVPTPEVRAEAPAAARDTAAWNTDGYATPTYTASAFGNAVGGFDQTKWADPNHQTPKYVVGRILQEAAGGSGRLADPAQRKAGIDKVLEAYPGATYDGKDKITFADGGTVDVFTGSGAGQYGIAWQPLTGAGGVPLDTGGAAGGARPGGSGLLAPGGSTLESIQGLMPTDTDFYKRLQDEVSRIVGGPQALERDALLKMLGA